MSLARLISSVLTLLTLLILARVVASFVVRDWSRGIPRFLWDVTEPILAPVRRLVPPMGGWDFSPLIVLFLAQLLSQYLRGA